MDSSQVYGRMIRIHANSIIVNLINKTCRDDEQTNYQALIKDRNFYGRVADIKGMIKKSG